MQIEIEVNDNNFDEKVIQQSKKIPVVTDFWAQWCSPCLILGPVLEKLAKEYNGKFILAKANINEAKISAQKYGVINIPAVKLFKNGKIVAEFVGAMPESAIKQCLDKNI
jgi:putative thioredoxin